MNPFKYQVIEWSRQHPFGTSNSIVATAATLRGCLSEYNKHLARYPETRKNLLKTVFMCDGVAFDVATTCGA